MTGIIKKKKRGERKRLAAWPPAFFSPPSSCQCNGVWSLGGIYPEAILFMFRYFENSIPPSPNQRNSVFIFNKKEIIVKFVI